MAMIKPVPDIKIINKYKQTMIDGLRHSFPLLNINELNEAIDWSINNRLYNGKASLKNNYTHKTINGTVLDILKYIESVEPIVTSSGVLYKKHSEMENPLNQMIMGFLDKRSEYKSTMFKYPKGSAYYEKYNLYQLLEKLNGNAVYGVIGAPTSLFYNVYVSEAITRQGRSYISCSIMLFESFLSNNVKFNSLNEIITFINNVEHEKLERKFDDSLILDRDITIEECFFKLMRTIDFTLWVPSEKEMTLVWEYLRGLSNEDINRIFYKNNLYIFCDLPVISNLIINILSKLGGEPRWEQDDNGKWKCDHNLFMNPNKAPKSIKDDLDNLTLIFKEYVYYPYFYVDKLDRIEYMKRDIVVVSDTDSTIVSFDAWYRFVLNKVYNIPMNIKTEKFDMVDIINTDEFGDKDLRTICEIVEPEYDYNFYTDEQIEIDRMIEPAKLIPQDMLRYAIINIMAYVCSDLVVDYLARYCKLCGSSRSDTKCKLVINFVTSY